MRKRKAQEEDVVKSGDYFSWMERGSESVSKEVYILPGSYIIVPCVKYPGVGTFSHQLLPFSKTINRQSKETNSNTQHGLGVVQYRGRVPADYRR